MVKVVIYIGKVDSLRCRVCILTFDQRNGKPVKRKIFDSPCLLEEAELKKLIRDAKPVLTKEKAVVAAVENGVYCCQTEGTMKYSERVEDNIFKILEEAFPVVGQKKAAA